MASQKRSGVILGSCVGLLAASLGAGLVVAGPGELIGYGLRATARITLLFFLLAYTARPLAQLTRSGWARTLLRNRRYLGLAAALSHTVHFGFVAAFLRTHSSEPLTLVFGGFGFVVFWVMAATSNDASVRRLGAGWRRLHGFGIHYLWGVFTVTLLPIALQDPAYWLPVALLVGALGLRVLAWRAARRPLVGSALPS